MDRSPVAPPSARARTRAAERLAGLATPAGALGRLGELAVWIAATQDAVPPRQLDNVRTVIFAGDHGVAAHGVSAYPVEITGLMVGTFRAGRAGVNALARTHGIEVRVEDMAVGRPSRPLHLEDALTAEETDEALARGAQLAAEEIAAGAQLLISGDMGIGNTTPSAALIAALLGLPASEVTGTGTGVAGEALAGKVAVIETALARTEQHHDAVRVLAALGGKDIAASAGFMVAAARAGVPVLLDGVVAVASAVVADAIAPGAAAWFAAGHRSTEPAQSLALDKLGLEPVLDLGMRLGEGSGAVCAVPILRNAIAVLNEVALLAELMPPPGEG